VSVEFEFTGTWRRDEVTFVLTDKKGKKLAAVKGSSLPYLDGGIVVVNGISEVLALASCMGHECYVQDGHIVALFYVVDKPVEGNENLAGGLPICPKNGKNKIDLSKIPEGCTCRFDSGDWAGITGARP
jgi:hypothetical protein